MLLCGIYARPFLNKLVYAFPGLRNEQPHNAFSYGVLESDWSPVGWGVILVFRFRK